MAKPSLPLIGASVALWCLIASVDAQRPEGLQLSASPPRDEVAKTGTAIIRGRVVAADTGKPIRWASVSLTSPQLTERRAALTDEQGRYELTALPAGTYTLNASKETFISLAYGQTRPAQAGRPLSIADKQIVEKVDFLLPRGGVISGRLYDELGDPVVNITVTAMRSQFGQGKRQLVRAGASSTTNDLGEYRLYGLQPGRYYVSATMRFPGGAVEAPRSGFAPSYYPGTTSFAEAQPVTVGLAQTLTGIDVRLAPVRTASVSGIIVDTEGHPLAAANVNLIEHGPANDKGVSFTVAKPDGSFTLSGVPPGHYSVDAVSTIATTAKRPALGDSGRATEPIAVDGVDVTGLRMSTQRLSGATGRISFDPPSAALAARLLHIGTLPVNPAESQLFAFEARIDADLTFDLQVPPGSMMLTAYQLPPGWMMKAVRVAGRDVIDSGLEFKPGERVDDFEIELTNRVPIVQGKVHDAKGTPVDDYAVLVFSQHREQWSDRRARYVAVARPDQAGTFTVATLPPGDYYVIALDYVDQNDAADPALLERLANDAVRVSLTDGETKTLDLKRQAE